MNIPLPDKKYKIILADPPWRYNDRSHRGGAESHYPTMRIDDICALDVPSISDDNSVLLMWATFPQLEKAFKVIKAWGFTYKTCAFVWVKVTSKNNIYMGMGRHTRANAELCLLGTRGKGLHRESAGVKNTWLYPRTKHSEKPHQFRAHIETLYGRVPRIELFARHKARGWDCWGLEAEESLASMVKSKLVGFFD